MIGYICMQCLSEIDVADNAPVPTCCKVPMEEIDSDHSYSDDEEPGQ